MHLYFFDKSEFGPQENTRNIDWWPHMDPRLLVLLDVFRFQWNRAVSISRHGQALGRRLGRESTSDHNVDRHGVVLAADVFPAGMDTPERAKQALELALDIGFTSMGVYPHWSSPGLHLGTRRSTEPGAPAQWGAIRKDGVQTFVSVREALEQWDHPT